MNHKNFWWIVIGGAVVLVAISLLFRARPEVNNTPEVNSTSQSPLMTVIAGENFWGSLVSQLGGDKVSVTSIVSDPNADPHEYESNADDAKLFAAANYVILNGAGYDSWGDSLLSAGKNANRKVLIVAQLLGKKEGDNPHFWYSPDYVNRVIAQMESDLISMDPKDTAYFQAQDASLKSSLLEYQNRIANIKQSFGGTKVASTESIFVYLADAAGLDLISPPEFIDAVAEGNDPPAGSVVEFEKQLNGHEPQVLVYNEQTVTPLTDNMKKLAAEANIPTIGITETIQPPDATFQEWMNAQLLTLQNALNAKALGK
jgi:zinc/manganese transport system substrate-binding protein